MNAETVSETVVTASRHSFDSNMSQADQISKERRNESIDDAAPVFVGNSDLQLDNVSSCPIPDAMAMDPLTPHALAVSSDFMGRIGTGLTLLRDHGKKVQKYVWKNRNFDILKKSSKSKVNILVVEAKDLPEGPLGGPNTLYCSFKLGSETHKCKEVSKSKAAWRERFNLHMYEDRLLEITVWHKGKKKTFMGRCSIDLSRLERERSHDLWQKLECGFGSLHLLITIGAAARPMPDDVLTNGVFHQRPSEADYVWYKLGNLEQVGQLSVTVHGARGLPYHIYSLDTYCVLELDNSRVQTHTVHKTTEPDWNKNFIFHVKDITSILEITINDAAILQSNEFVGRVSIPLLRIENNVKKWYQLKNQKYSATAKGHSPRILLQMSVVWNPVKASLAVMSPKTQKYIKTEHQFNIPLIYSNLKFIRDIFHIVYNGNEKFKMLFEWEDRQTSFVALLAWLVFWSIFQIWMLPVIIMLTFIRPFFIKERRKSSVGVSLTSADLHVMDDLGDDDNKTVRQKLSHLQDLTYTIKNGIDFIVSLLERLHNLTVFAVPYLSYLTLVLLAIASLALYFIPGNYIFMALGIYKFTRKYFNPDRVPNNDILDFISRVPDNVMLKKWEDLTVLDSNNHPQLTSEPISLDEKGT